MSVSRRGFLNIVGAGRTAALSGVHLAARGHEEETAYALLQGGRRPMVPAGVQVIRISSNENPLGPGKAVIDTILGKFPEANRYPFNSTPLDSDLRALIASKNSAKPANVVLGTGSQELLRNAVRAFCSPTKALVTGAPSYENCPGEAKKLGFPIKDVPVDKSLKLDLGAMAAAAKGAGLVFLNNPNNPTATVHSAKDVEAFVNEVRKTSPDTAILIDEAYCDYVTDPSFATAIPVALNTPNVFVARTFSKAYGMAGIRIGYIVGTESTVKAVGAFNAPYNVNTFGVAAAITSLNDPQHIKEEAARNTQVKNFTTKALMDLGAKPTDSQTNFIFVNIGRTAKSFRDACAQSGVFVGRDFPPFENTHARISIGTMEEMQKAVEVFRNVLRAATPTAAGKQQ